MRSRCWCAPTPRSAAIVAGARPERASPSAGSESATGSPIQAVIRQVAALGSASQLRAWAHDTLDAPSRRRARVEPPAVPGPPAGGRARARARPAGRTSRARVPARFAARRRCRRSGRGSPPPIRSTTAVRAASRCSRSMRRRAASGTRSSWPASRPASCPTSRPPRRRDAPRRDGCSTSPSRGRPTAWSSPIAQRRAGTPAHASPFLAGLVSGEPEPAPPPPRHRPRPGRPRARRADRLAREFGTSARHPPDRAVHRPRSRGDRPAPTDHSRGTRQRHVVRPDHRRATRRPDRTDDRRDVVPTDSVVIGAWHRCTGQVSRSTMTGAWSLGDLPLRALRSMTHHSARSATDAEHISRSMRRPRPWWKSPAR